MGSAITVLLVHRKNLPAELYVNQQYIGNFYNNAFNIKDEKNTILKIQIAPNSHSIRLFIDIIEFARYNFDKIEASKIEDYFSALIIIDDCNKINYYKNGISVIPTENSDIKFPYDLNIIFFNFSKLKNNLT